MANSTGPDPLSPEERRAVLREHLEREKERRRTAEAKVAAIAEQCREAIDANAGQRVTLVSAAYILGLAEAGSTDEKGTTP